MLIYNNNKHDNMEQGLGKHHKSIFDYFQKIEDNKMDLDEIWEKIILKLIIKFKF